MGISFEALILSERLGMNFFHYFGGSMTKVVLVVQVHF